VQVLTKVDLDIGYSTPKELIFVLLTRIATSKNEVMCVSWIFDMRDVVDVGLPSQRSTSTEMHQRKMGG